MPVVSVCPYCNRGRVRADDEAIGTSAKCPSCGSEFTIIPSDEEAVVGAGSLSPSSSSSVPSVFAEEAPPRRSVAARSTPTPTQPLASETLPDVTPEAPAKPARPVGDPDELPDPARLPGLIAAAIGLAGMVAWMIPDYGRLVWLVIAVVAAVVGGFSLLAADRKKLFAWIGLGTAGGSLLLCLALPSLLGEGWWPERGYNTDEAVAVGAGGEQTDGRKEIDAAKAVWFRDGVRVAVVSVRRGPVDVINKPAGSKKPVVKKSAEVLQIVVEVSNEGYPKPITFTGWTDSIPPTLHTGTGAPIALRKFEGTVPGEPPTNPQSLPIGGVARQTLYFDPPPEGSGGGGKLTLPVTVIDGQGEPIRFAVPYSGLNRSEFKPGGGR